MFKPMFIKLCVAMPWYIVLIFQGRRTKVKFSAVLLNEIMTVKFSAVL